MHDSLLVDGYNLFYAARGSSHARLFPDIKRLAFFLEHYAVSAGGSVVLVIDGTRFSDEFVETRALRVLFSRPGESADAVMEAWMARLASSERLSWTLVSNDLNLCRMGAGMGLRVRPCAAVVDDLARFASTQSTSVYKNPSPSRASDKPFNNPFGTLALALGILTGALFAVSGPAEASEFTGFVKPDSAVADVRSGEIFVSNDARDEAAPVEGIVPVEKEPPAGGFVSKVSGNGLVLVQKFIQGGPEGSGRELRSPKGMTVGGGRLYVADGDSIAVYRTDTGSFIERIRIESQPSVSLGPVTAGPKGIIFAADTNSSRIYAIDTRRQNAVTLFSDLPALKNPRGLAFDAETNQLFVVTANSGQLVRIDKRGRPYVMRKGLGDLDGIFIDLASTVYLASSRRGEVYRIPDRGRGVLALAAGGLREPRGIGYDAVHREALVPLRGEGRLTTFSTESQRSAFVPKNIRPRT